MHTGWVMVLEGLGLKLECVIGICKPFQESVFQVDVSET